MDSEQYQSQLFISFRIEIWNRNDVISVDKFGWMNYSLVMKPKNNNANQQNVSKRSFIEVARRSQIIEATIVVLAEKGYTNTTFVRIAEQAGFRPGLISYYFKNKDELTYEVLATITHVTYKIKSNFVLARFRSIENGIIIGQ